MEINLSLQELAQLVSARFDLISGILNQTTYGMDIDISDDVNQGIEDFEEAWEMYKEKVLEEVKEK